MRLPVVVSVVVLFVLFTPVVAAAPASSRGGLGASVVLGPWTKHAGCMVRGALPDRACTPGARFRLATRERVCRSGYSAMVRNVTVRARSAVYAAYGISRRFNGRDGELDHLVSLELGGSNSQANLFPEAAEPRPGAHEKDRLENRLHAEVCNGTLSLRRAQEMIARDWPAAYRDRFG